ncbi:hypothetical protein [Parachitinimonas caeni]|uniref:Uncharacterized protein n=1 Tax=Parachitinimonas caeni TaxID=3031301 RepID=A0ABT7E0I2_9NEIS|nr:hypothetical protein [Parachitinimonas caeni]MDK2125825.1 hypothetical protein [Parachitinimonas caeni]
MGISKKEAIDLIKLAESEGAPLTVSQLRELAGKVSAKFDSPAENAVMFLNSGLMPDKVTKSEKVVFDIINKGSYHSIVTINAKLVDVSGFIQSDEFVVALEKAVSATTPIDKVDAKIYEIMNGSKDAKGVRLPDGIWDDASRRFVLESATEHVRVMVGGAAPDSVFVLS